jgi:hypothetical protein
MGHFEAQRPGVTEKCRLRGTSDSSDRIASEKPTLSLLILDKPLSRYEKPTRRAVSVQSARG